MRLMSPFIEDRSLLRRRLLSAWEARTLLAPYGRGDRCAAIGYCFGGLCALDLARAGVSLAGAVSFHGLLHAPEYGKKEKIAAKVLALHGHDDPMVRPSEVLAFEQEMSEQRVDWQVHVYGGTMHAFTNPIAQDPSAGTVYNAVADRRSWIAMAQFFHELFQ